MGITGFSIWNSLWVWFHKIYVKLWLIIFDYVYSYTSGSSRTVSLPLLRPLSIYFHQITGGFPTTPAPVVSAPSDRSENWRPRECDAGTRLHPMLQKWHDQRHNHTDKNQKMTDPIYIYICTVDSTSHWIVHTRNWRSSAQCSTRDLFVASTKLGFPEALCTMTSVWAPFGSWVPHGNQNSHVLKGGTSLWAQSHQDSFPGRS